jgi:hypothetical protein
VSNPEHISVQLSLLVCSFMSSASWTPCTYSMVGRELKRWQPSADDAPLEGGLEDSRGGAWDQFGVNHHKFGVQTSFQVSKRLGRAALLARLCTPRLVISSIHMCLTGMTYI